ncbi:polynucleotide adenylyltransferase PcnB [soil metagenome]
MIKKLIDKLLGRPGAPKGARKSAASGASAAVDIPEIPTGKRVEYTKAEHKIDPKLVDDHALRVVQGLTDAGHEAYIVGGAVRDLLLGMRPKDFDVATNATPEQVKSLFRRAFIIGRRFRIVHVVFGRGRENEVIEVSTFRAYLDAAAADQVAGNEKNSKESMMGKTHVVDASGRVLRDNVWGPQIEDAARRDFTINAMYYDPQREVVVDYHGGMKDAKAKLLRMIGDPVTRYREDPVRIVRVVRFAAKLGFEIEPKTRAPIKEMAALLANVPPSRMFDEMIKLLQTGHSLASLEELRKQGLHRGVFPLIDVVLDEAHRHDGREKFVQRALSDTDARVAIGKPVAPSYMLACMLWHDVLDRWQQTRAEGVAPTPALQQAVDSVFDARIGDISGRGKLAGDMREIWMMQPRFERRSGNGPYSLVQQPRYRAGLDFLHLREHVGEVVGLWAWWDEFALANDERRVEMIEQARVEDAARKPAGAARPAKPKRVRSAAPKVAGEGADAPAGQATARAGATDAGSDEADAERPESQDDSDEDLPLGPARKKRRRRRKPAARAEGDGGASSADAAPASHDASGSSHD